MFPPNLDPQSFTLSAAIVGALIAPEFNAAEANTIGNWLVLVGDYLLTYAGQLALITARNNLQNTSSQDQMASIVEALRKMEKEVANLRDKHNL